MLAKLDLGRFTAFIFCGILAVASLLGLFWSVWMLIPLLAFTSLTVLGSIDVTQRSHSILRNYPVLGHMRFLLRRYSPRNPAIPDRKRSGRRAVQPRRAGRWSISVQRGRKTSGPLARACGCMMRAMPGSPIRCSPCTLRTPIFACALVTRTANSLMTPRFTTSRR